MDIIDIYLATSMFPKDGKLPSNEPITFPIIVANYTALFSENIAVACPDGRVDGNFTLHGCTICIVIMN